MPPSGRANLAGQTGKDTKPSKKEQILGALNRINDKATLKVASEELKTIVHELDLEHIPVLLNGLCSTGLDIKPFGKKECLVALTEMLSPECPVRSAVMNPPYLNKVLGHIKKSMQDSDSIVRDASAAFLEAAMAYLSEAAGGLLPGNLTQPIIKVIFDCLNEGKKEAQFSAATALRLISPNIGPLDKDLVKEILKMLKNSAFQATSLLLLAIASVNPKTMQLHGLLMTGADAFLPILSKVLGAAPGSTTPGGVLPCLQKSDWQVRKAAAECLNAMAMLLGPQMEPGGIWERYNPDSLTGRCLAALEQCKFDRVKLVRDAVLDAIATIQELQSHGSSGGSLQAWRQMLDISSPRKVTAPTSPSGSHPFRPSSANPLRQSSMHERFIKAQPGSDAVTVLEPPPKQRPMSAMPVMRQSSQSEASLDDIPSRRAPVRMSAPTLAAGVRRRTKDAQQVDPSNVAVSVSLDGSIQSGEQLPSPAGSLQQDNRGVVGFVQVPVEQWQETVGRLQALEELIPEMVDKQTELVQQLATLRELRLQVVELPELRAEVAALRQAVEAQHEELGSLQRWQEQHLGLHRMEQDKASSGQASTELRLTSLETQQATSSLEPLRPSKFQHAAPTPLQTSTESLHSYQAPEGPSITSPSITPSRFRMPIGSPAGIMGISPSQSSEDPITFQNGDLDTMYGEALKGKKLDLLRLMGRTQPVWQHLSTDTALSLLDALAGFLEEGVRVAMMMQWLWRIVDDNSSPQCDIPQDLRVHITNAVATIPENDEAWVTENGEYLLNSLLQEWRLPNPLTTGAVIRRSSSRRITFESQASPQPR